MTHSSSSANRITRSSMLTNTPRVDVMRGVDSSIVESCNAMVMRRILPDGNERTSDLKYWLYDDNKMTMPCDDALSVDVKTVDNNTKPIEVNANLCVGTVTGDVLCFPYESTDVRGMNMNDDRVKWYL